MAQNEKMYLKGLRQDYFDVDGKFHKGQISMVRNGKYGDYQTVSIPWDKKVNGVPEAPTGWILFNVKVSDQREGVYMSRDFSKGSAEEPAYRDGYYDVKLNPSKSYPVKVDTGITVDMLDENGAPVLNEDGTVKQKHKYSTKNIPGAVIYQEYRAHIEAYKAAKGFDKPAEAPAVAAPAKAAEAKAAEEAAFEDFEIDDQSASLL